MERTAFRIQRGARFPSNCRTRFWFVRAGKIRYDANSN